MCQLCLPEGSRHLAAPTALARLARCVSVCVGCWGAGWLLLGVRPGKERGREGVCWSGPRPGVGFGGPVGVLSCAAESSVCGSCCSVAVVAVVGSCAGNGVGQGHLWLTCAATGRLRTVWRCTVVRGGSVATCHMGVVCASPAGCVQVCGVRCGPLSAPPRPFGHCLCLPCGGNTWQRQGALGSSEDVGQFVWACCACCVLCGRAQSWPGPAFTCCRRCVFFMCVRVHCMRACLWTHFKCRARQSMCVC